MFSLQRYKGRKAYKIKSQGVSIKREKSVTTIHNIVVIFERKIWEIKVIAPGSRIVVFIGEDGKVVGFQKKWRGFEKNPLRKSG